MKLSAQDAKGRPLHLTYCTNIHPAETWPEVFEVVNTHVLAVKRLISPTQPFGIGLRLSFQAARTLVQNPNTLVAFRQYLNDNDLYVFTINGFPYGPFHGQPVKEQVYRPDWIEIERLNYTELLAGVLAVLMPRPEDPLGQQLGPLVGSISTVPGCFRGRAASDSRAMVTMAENLRRAAATLVGIRADGGPQIGLALEPEPHCVFETTAEVLRFFEQHLFTEQSALRFAELTRLDKVRAAEALRRHLGICLDACHAAVEYEDPEQTLADLQSSGVSVFKLQVSAGLRMSQPTRRAVQALKPFVEDTYLHQTVVRRGAALIRHLDLPDALAAAETGDVGEEWRVHFHVPVFTSDLANEMGRFESTSAFLKELLGHFARAPLSPHVEVETYTWNVLPESLRTLNVDEAIAQELRWTQALLSPAP